MLTPDETQRVINYIHQHKPADWTITITEPTTYDFITDTFTIHTHQQSGSHEITTRIIADHGTVTKALEDTTP